MLFKGEKLGTGRGPQVDAAVDPVEGTNLLAYGRPNAISVVGVSPAGTMFDPGPSYYMEKLVVSAEARDAVDLSAPVAANLSNIARALGKDVGDLVVFVLDKPRHKDLINTIREAGARIQLHSDGDVAGSLMAVDPNSEVDVMMGTGGTPEGVLSACAIRAMGGEMRCRLDPPEGLGKEGACRSRYGSLAHIFGQRPGQNRRCVLCRHRYLRRKLSRRGDVYRHRRNHPFTGHPG